MRRCITVTETGKCDHPETEHERVAGKRWLCRHVGCGCVEYQDPTEHFALSDEQGARLAALLGFETRNMNKTEHEIEHDETRRCITVTETGKCDHLETEHERVAGTKPPAPRPDRTVTVQQQTGWLCKHVGCGCVEYAPKILYAYDDPVVLARVARIFRAARARAQARRAAEAGTTSQKDGDPWA